MLPEHEGGVFETVTSGSRALSRHLQDPNAPFQDEGKWGYWVNQAVWGTSKSVGDTASYDVSGWGIGLGAEIKSDVGNFGGSIAFLSGKDGNGSNANEVSHQPVRRRAALAPAFEGLHGQRPRIGRAHQDEGNSYLQRRGGRR